MSSLCPKCTTIPSLQLIVDQKISINCSCGYKSVEFLEEYLSQYTTRKSKDNSEQPINQIITKKQDYINILHEAEEHMNSYFASLINKYKNNSTVEKAYNECIKRNEAILSFVRILIDNFNEQNQTMDTNIENNCTLNIYKCIIEDNLTSVIGYFANYNFSIVKGSSTSISTEPSTIIQLHDKRIAICAQFSKTLYIANPSNNFTNDITIKRKEDSFEGICQLDNDNIVIYGYSIILIFSIDKTTYKFIKKIKQDTIDFIFSLSNNRFAVILDRGEEPGMLIYSFDSDTPLKEIKEDFYVNEHSYCYNRDKEILALLMHDNELQLWSMLTYQCVSVIKTGFIISLAVIDNERILFGGISRLSVVNIVNNTIERVLCENLQYLSIAKLNEEYLICGCSRGKIALFNAKTMKCSAIQTSQKGKIELMVKTGEDAFITRDNVDKHIFLWKNIV